jgi:stage II sporulation protein R
VIPNESIRLRIIPNSNSSLDIIMKENTKKEIMEIVNNFDSVSIDSSRKEIVENVSNVENKVKKLFDDNNYNETFVVNYGLNKFPEKIYKGVKYKEGYYESLVVEIGNAKGNNFWCVLYPPLCLIDENKETNYKSKIIEIVRKFF